jgi:hypothetical protein
MPAQQDHRGDRGGYHAGPERDHLGTFGKDGLHQRSAEQCGQRRQQVDAHSLTEPDGIHHDLDGGHQQADRQQNQHAHISL